MPGDLPNPGTEPSSPALQADSLPYESSGKPLFLNICIPNQFLVSTNFSVPDSLPN